MNANKIFTMLLTSAIGLGQLFLYDACQELKLISKQMSVLQLNDTMQNTALNEINMNIKDMSKKLFENNIFTRDEVAKLEREIQTTEKLCAHWKHTLELKINEVRK